MALPVPTFIGQVYTDPASSRSWICTSVNPPMWSVNRISNLSLGGGLVAGGDISASGNAYFGKGIVLSPAVNGRYTGIGTQNYFDGFYSVFESTMPSGGFVEGAFMLGVARTPSPVFGPTGYAFLHLLQATSPGPSAQGPTGSVAIKVMRGNNAQAYVNYEGEFYGKGTLLSSDEAQKANITNYNESSVRFGKWLSAIRNNFNPYSFTYVNSPGLGIRYGYLAQDLQKVDSKLAKSDFVISQISTLSATGGVAQGSTGDTGGTGATSDEGASGDNISISSLTGTSNYYISQDQLLFGAVEAIRELDAEACRVWKTPCPPPPSRAKDNDLWFDPTSSNMYIRFNDGTKSHWIQTS